MLPKLVINSDAGPFDCEFGRMVFGLRLAVEGGMTTTQAIEAATRVAASACHVGHLVGTLEAEKKADLMIVGGDPIIDIETMADVRAVYVDGRNIGPLTRAALLPGARW
jgi:imidazolonepropionase-like amidohydrolase